MYLNLLRKRKTTVWSVTNVEDNPKSDKSSSSEGATSSMTSKKHRRK